LIHLLNAKIDDPSTDEDTSKKSSSLALDRRSALIVGALVGIVAFVVAVRDVRVVLYDDAAITLRYAWRIAHGGGFTYNPADRTDGASAPLYTLIIAFISFLGGGLIGAAKLICIASFTLTCGLLSYLASRMAGFIAGLVAPIRLFGSQQGLIFSSSDQLGLPAYRSALIR